MRNILFATVALLALTGAAEARKADTDQQAVSRALGCITDSECEGLDAVPEDRAADTVFEPGSPAAARADLAGVSNAELLSRRSQHLKALREIRGEMRFRAPDANTKTMREVEKALKIAR